ncbi:MAG: arginyltransferase [Deltaproteobacteria bacterium]|nr:arginyltransferase [Deltaproteobacteria bacterium]
MSSATDGSGIDLSDPQRFDTPDNLQIIESIEGLTSHSPIDVCPYLPARQMRLGLLYGTNLRPEQFDLLLARGYRRSGPLLYLPDCPGSCRQCLPIRISLRDFAPSRSQRRVWRRSQQRLTVRVSTPHFDPDHLALHNRHLVQVSPDNRPCDAEDYHAAFIQSCVTTRLIEYRIDGELAALSVLDLGKAALSSHYVCWDPRFARFSLGTLTALWEMRWGLAQGFTHYYLGYLVRQCTAMNYKDRFRPFELLDWASLDWSLGQ